MSALLTSLLKMFGGGKKGETQPSPQVAIAKLRETEEMLEKKSEFIEKNIEVELATAKKCGFKNKRGGLGHESYRAFLPSHHKHKWLTVKHGRQNFVQGPAILDTSSNLLCWQLS